MFFGNVYIWKEKNMNFFYDLLEKLKNNYYIILICILFIVINDAIILGDFYNLKNINRVLRAGS